MSSNTRPLSVAILGAGIFAREAHLPAIAVIAASSNIKLEAVYSRSRGSASALAELATTTLKLDSAVKVYADDAEGGLDALLARSDITAVIVVLPLTQQPEIVIKALKAGKHVLSEKPVAKDVKTALELIKTYENEYKSKGLVWRVAENFEVEPATQAVAEIIKSGKIGKVAFFKLTAIGFIDKENKWYQTSWRTVPEYQGGFLLDGGVHSVALLRTILPGEFTGVTGFASLTKEYLPPHDTITSVIQTSTGAHGIFEMSFAAPLESRGESKTTITGTDGYIEMTSEKRATGEDKEEKQHWVVKVVGKDGKEETNAYPYQGVEKEIAYFAEAVRGSKDAVVLATGDPRGALKDVAVIEASLNSKGSLVDVKALVGA